MTRPGSGVGPDDGRLGRPLPGRLADGTAGSPDGGSDEWAARPWDHDPPVGTVGAWNGVWPPVNGHARHPWNEPYEPPAVNGHGPVAGSEWAARPWVEEPEEPAADGHRPAGHPARGAHRWDDPDEPPAANGHAPAGGPGWVAPPSAEPPAANGHAPAGRLEWVARPSAEPPAVNGHAPAGGAAVDRPARSPWVGSLPPAELGGPWPPDRGHGPSAAGRGSGEPTGLTPPYPADLETTQLLHRYVPVREVLDREERDAPTAAPPPAHPPRAVVRRRRARRRRLEWPFLIVFALLSAYLIRAFVVQTFYIPSGSMHETLLEGDRVLVNKVGYHLHDVSRGDVVVFRRPPDFQVEDEDLIKRVIALPGETVEARGRTIYVNGRPLAEPYVEPACRGTEDFQRVRVPRGSLWVMGDNRCNSSDSRVFGPVDRDLVVGRAFVLAWPFDRLSWL
jgi:signal peptidase I